MQKKLHVEFLRVIAIFWVLFNHTGEYGYQLYVAASNPIKYMAYGMVSVLCKIAVPLFFMIAGALLLGKEESISTIWKKRILRIFIVLIVMSLFYYIRNWGYDITQFSLTEFILEIYTSQTCFHLWYLYAYITVLMLLPITRKMVKVMQKEDYNYIIMLMIVFVILRGSIKALFGINLNSWVSLYVLTDVLFFPLMGYYFENVFEIDKIKIGHILGCIGVIVVGSFLAVLFTRIEVARTGMEYTEIYLGTFNCTNAIAVYILAKYAFEKCRIPDVLRRVIEFYGETTFGIYLLDVVLRSVIYIRTYSLLYPYVGTMLASLISVMCCVIFGGLFVGVIKKVPVINKYV